MQRSRTRTNQNTTVILDKLDVGKKSLKSSFRQVSGSSKIRLGTVTDSRVRGREECYSITDGIVTGCKAVVEDISSFHLLSVGHRAGKTSGTNLGEGVVQVVFHCFLSDRESKGNSLMVVAGRVRLLRRIELNSRAFSLGRGRAKAGEEDFFLKRPVRVLDFEQSRMLIVHITILNTKDSVKTGEKFFSNITAINSHDLHPP